MNPFTESIDRKAFLLWNVLLTLIFYGVTYAFKSNDVILILIDVVAVVFGLLLAVRRMQSTGINMWLLLALFLPIANIILLIALFFIPPKKPPMEHAPIASAPSNPQLSPTPTVSQPTSPPANDTGQPKPPSDFTGSTPTQFT